MSGSRAIERIEMEEDRLEMFYFKIKVVIAGR